MELNSFEKNIEALARRYPRLAKNIRELPPPHGIVVKQSNDGLPIFGVRRGDGQETFLYDRLNTRQKIEEDLKSLMFKAEDATLFLGFGLGYHVEEIARRMELDHQLFVVEPCIEILRLALACRDLTAILGHEAIHLFAGRDLTRLHEMLEYHLLRLVAGQLNNITLSPLRATFAQIYAEAEDQIQKTLLHLKLTYRHLLENDVVLKNVLSNASFIFIPLEKFRVLLRFQFLDSTL